MTQETTLSRCTRAAMTGWEEAGEVPFPLYEREAAAIARAVIQALMEPDTALLDAGFDNDDLGIIWTAAITPDDRKEMWKAMLQHILDEE